MESILASNVPVIMITTPAMRTLSFLCTGGFLFTLFTMTTGTNITTRLGTNQVIQWTLAPLPSSTSTVAILHPTQTGGDYATLFTALGSAIINGQTSLSKRVKNAKSSNTVIGHVQFTLDDITVDDAGDYRAKYTPIAGGSAITRVGVTLVVYVKPSIPIITEDAPPVDGNNMVLNCSAISNSKPDDQGLYMKYTWLKNDVELSTYGRFVTVGHQLQVKNISKADTNSSFRCKAYELKSLPSDSSDTYAVVVKYGPGSVSPEKVLYYELIEDSDNLGPITCSADCVPACGFQWKFNGVDFNGTDDTLTIKNIQRPSAGTYWCVAFNLYGTAKSQNVTVKIQHGPGEVTIIPNKAFYNQLENNKETIGPITCNADCVPECSYQWSRDGFTVSNNSSLVIQNVGRVDSGVYVCRANNTVDDKNSLPVNVSVEYVPENIKLLPSTSSYSVVEYASVEPITCNADCNPLCKYRWKHDGEYVPQTSVLSLEKIQRNQSGTYTCEAWNVRGSINSLNVSVIVQYGPDTVTLNPSTGFYNPAETPKEQLGPITCSAKCIPECSYQWSRDGLFLTNSAPLIIRDINRTASGMYVCRAYNAIGGRNSSSVNVHVEYKPENIQLQPSDTQKSLLEKTMLGPINCSAVCNPPCQYRWMHDGKSVTVTSDLKIEMIKRHQSGTYTCVAWNKRGNATSGNVTVTVQYGPDVVMFTPNNTFYNPPEKEALEPIECSADCVPGCFYQWSRDGSLISNTATLTKQTIDRTDSGIYACKAENVIDSKNSSSVIVSVEYAPGIVTLQPQKTQKTPLENTTQGPINCSADCNPPCLYRWIHGNSTVTENAVLVQEKIKRDQNGTYICVAWNRQGNKTSQVVTVNVLYGPGDVTFSPNNRSYVLVESIRDTLGPITCQSDCNPKCTYSWTMNNTVIQNQGQNLKMNNVVRNQAGVYTCTARNSILDNSYNSSTSISVAVEYGPGGVMLVPSNSSYTLLEKNDTLRPIGCSAVCLPPCTYEWTKNGDKLGFALMSQQRTVKRTMSGEYICSAKNVYNISTAVVHVVVEYAPDPPILAKSATGVLAESEPLFLSCTTDSFPLPDMTIESLEITEKHYITQNSLINNVTVNRADCLDTGRYTCTATNKIGSSVSSEVLINVTCAPRLDKQLDTPTTIYIGDNENLDIIAPIIANPRPVLSWEFKTNTSNAPIMLHNGTDDFTYYKEANHVTYRVKAEKSSMQSDDYGLYILNASNSFNYTKITFRVFAKRSPDPPYAASVQCDGQTDANVLWKSNFNGGEQQHFVVNTLTSSGKTLTNDKTIADKGKNILHETTIAKLNPNTRYSFVIEAHNSNGHSKFEQLLNCTTKPLEKKSGAPLALIGGLAGGLAALIIFVVILGVVLFVKRRKHKKEEDTQLMNLRDNQDEGMKANILYESAGPFLSRQIDDPGDPEYAEVDKSRGEPSNNSSNDVYATVQKNKTTTEDPSAMYSVVQKPNKASKSAETTKGKKQMKGKGKAKGDKKQVKKGKRDDVYENFGATFEDEYANFERKPKQGSSEDKTQSKQKTPSRRKNKDGLTYIDVEIMDNGKGPKINGIHGADKRVDYVDIDFTRRADPLPSSSDEDEQPGDSSSAQPQTEKQQ